MSYVVDPTYYDYIKNAVHFECLHELQLVELSSYGIRCTLESSKKYCLYHFNKNISKEKNLEMIRYFNTHGDKLTYSYN